MGIILNANFFLFYIIYLPFGRSLKISVRLYKGIKVVKIYGEGMVLKKFSVLVLREVLVISSLVESCSLKEIFGNV